METKKLTKKLFEKQVCHEMKTPTIVKSFDQDDEENKRYTIYKEYPSRASAEKMAFWKLTGHWCDKDDIESFWKGDMALEYNDVVWVKWGKNNIL